MSNPYLDRLTVTKVTMMKSESNLKAFASVKLGNTLTIHDCRIIQQTGQKPFVSLPQRKDEATGKYFYIVYPEDKLFQEALQTKVLAAWQEQVGAQAEPAMAIESENPF